MVGRHSPASPSIQDSTGGPSALGWPQLHSEILFQNTTTKKNLKKFYCGNTCIYHKIYYFIQL